MMPETHSNTITEIRASEAICPVCQTKSQMMLAKTVSRPDNLICPACGLVFQPRETESQAKLAACYEGDGYWNASTVKLSRYTRISVLDDIRRGRPRLKMIEKLLGRRLGQTDRVLDIGCGYGGLLWQIRRRGITKVTGLEPSPVCSQAAQSLLGLDIHCKMFEETDCSIPGGYSLITSLHTLEHVSDPIDLLRRAGELLAAEGRLYIEVPNLLAPSVGFPLLRFFEEAHISNFTLTSLTRTAEIAGLSVLAADDTGFVRVILGKKPKSQPSNLEFDARDAEAVRRFIKTYQEGQGRIMRRLRTFFRRANYAFSLGLYPLVHPLVSLRILRGKTCALT